MIGEPRGAGANITAAAATNQTQSHSSLWEWEEWFELVDCGFAAQPLIKRKVYFSFIEGWWGCLFLFFHFFIKSNWKFEFDWKKLKRKEKKAARASSTHNQLSFLLISSSTINEIDWVDWKKKREEIQLIGWLAPFRQSNHLISSISFQQSTNFFNN